MKKLVMTSLGIFFLCLNNTQASFYDVNLGLGLMNEAIGRYQTDVAGDKSKFNNRLTLEAGGSYVLDEAKKWNIHGDFGFLFPAGEEDYITRNVYYLTSHVGYMIHEKLEFRLGGSLYFTRISGDGGTATIRNGSGFTNFPIPEEASISRNVTLNIALDYEFYKDFSIRGESFIFNPANSRNRTFNLALTLRYHFGERLWQK